MNNISTIKPNERLENSLIRLITNLRKDYYSTSDANVRFVIRVTLCNLTSKVKIDLTKYDFIKEHLNKLIDNLQINENTKQILKNSIDTGLEIHNMYNFFSYLFLLNKGRAINDLIQGLSNYLEYVLGLDDEKERIIGLYFAGVWLAGIVTVVMEQLPCPDIFWSFDKGLEVGKAVPMFKKLFELDNIDQIILSNVLETEIKFFLKKTRQIKEYAPEPIKLELDSLINLVSEKIYHDSNPKEEVVIKS